MARSRRALKEKDADALRNERRFTKQIEAMEARLMAMNDALERSMANEGRLVEENDALLMEQNRLGVRVRTLEREKAAIGRECMEIESELEAVRAELMTAQKLDTSRYHLWNSDEAVDWICSIENGRFTKYQEKLLRAFTEEGVCGEDLDKITQSALRDWGVKNFKDRVALHEHIQELVTHHRAASASSNVSRSRWRDNEGTKETEWL